MWWTKRAIGLHITVVVVVPTFLGLFWWQVQRVRQGNTLSWAYVFEWPFFTGYAVYLWWKLVHDQPEQASGSHDAAVQVHAPRAGATDAGAGVTPAADAGKTGGGLRAQTADQDDEELAAYNRYLAELNASGRPKRW
jgi:hypothetical protein